MILCPLVRNEGWSGVNFLNRLFQWLGPHPRHVCVCYLAHYIVRLSEEFEGRSKSRGVLVSCECLSVHLCALGLEFDQLKIKYLLLAPR